MMMSTAAMNPVDRAKAKIKELGGASTEEPVVAATEPTGGQPTAPTDPAPQATGEKTKPVSTATPQQQQPKEGQGAENFEHKYLTLQGHYRQAQDKVSTLTNELETLKSTVAELKEKGQPDPLPDGASPEEIAKHLQTLQEDYGDTFQHALSGYVDGRIKTLEKTINKLLEDKLGEMQDHVEDVAHETVNVRSEKFKSDLKAIVPDWEGLYDDAMVGWLETNTEAMSGRSYLELFREANNDWDLARVARFFTTYKQATGQQNQNPGNAPQASAAPAAPADPREQLIAPGTGSSTGQAAPSDVGGQAQIVKWSDVQNFYKQAQTGAYRGREDEMNQIIAEINKANHEGRIVHG